jgi:hypothetical protein
VDVAAGVQPLERGQDGDRHLDGLAQRRAWEVAVQPHRQGPTRHGLAHLKGRAGLRRRDPDPPRDLADVAAAGGQEVQRQRRELFGRRAVAGDLEQDVALSLVARPIQHISFVREHELSNAVLPDVRHDPPASEVRRYRCGCEIPSRP